ncbi:hypothetical protein BDF20DRAFT_135731 [Mycotypha africana]|uniref:uncharacterized protein n=1 Tax=Mycotypha africana TaxID=64632 RepID=UPI00230196FE|nr:uncharacterized protein BDF20DRAFT_135731 [Mycotypha africana]KAI8968951.1 hypothetical protein BDF20DRAFT_135731 [Mycotypha africana]
MSAHDDKSDGSKIKAASEIEQIERVHTKLSVSSHETKEEDVDYKGVSEKTSHHEEDRTKKNIFLRFKDSIYSKPEKTENIWHLLTNLTNTQRITFAAAFFGWTLDAFDFFSVSLTATRIAEDFGVQPSDVTSAITTTLVSVIESTGVQKTY